MRMHALAVIHRRTLCKNMDIAKIKVPFYTTDINILHMASMHRIVIYRVDISMNRYTPLYLLIHHLIWIRTGSGNCSDHLGWIRTGLGGYGDLGIRKKQTNISVDVNLLTIWVG